MSAVPYLLKLTARLADGLAALSPDDRRRFSDFLRSNQNADGGFSGREGGSDLYYTGFALRSLAILDALSADVCSRAADYLDSCRHQQTGIADFFSFLYSCALVELGGGPNVLAASPADWPARVATLLESFRTPDGGYAKAIGNASGSTYNTFLVALCHELLAKEIRQPEAIVAFIVSRHREDGGFVEIAPMRRSGANPTAAAIATLQMLDENAAAASALAEYRGAACAFYAGLVSVEGGYRANARVPLADLLSTFTSLWTLEQLGESFDAVQAAAYVRALATDAGGFRGGHWDEQTDVEYTFYGLGSLALLQSPPTP